MRYIKSYDDESNISMEEIFDILTDITDDGYDVVLYDVRGFPYNIDDIKNPEQVKSFVVSKEVPKKTFGFQILINFNQKTFIEYIDILSKLSPIIARFGNLGWLVRDEYSSKYDNGFSLKYKSIKISFTKPSLNKYDDDIMDISEEDINFILSKYGLVMDVGSDYDQVERTIIIYYEPQGERYPEPSTLGRILRSIKVDLDATSYEVIDQGRVKFFF